jgi:hypothetical protein
VFPLFDWSITSFTVIMSLVSIVALTAVYGALRNVVQRPWPALALYIPFLAMALQPWSVNGDVREFNGIYYPIMPERYLVPFVLAWLLARHLRRGSPPVWLLFGVAGLGVLNNFDFGMACLVALCLALPLGFDRELPFGPWLRTVAVEAAAGLAGSVVLVSLVILVRAGELPDFGLVGYVARLAGRGFSFAAMPEWGLHWALYATYVGALLTAAVRCARAEPDRVLTAMLGFAGAFGLATGTYFGGRSLPWQLWGLFPAWGLALSLLGWTALGALRDAAADQPSLRRVAIAAFAALAGFGVMVASIDRFPLPWQQVERIRESGTAIHDYYGEQAFIEKQTDDGEHVLILGRDLEHRLAERAGVVNVSPWFGTLALLSPNETERAIDQLEESGGTKVFMSILDYFAGPDLNRHIEEAFRERGYEPVATEPGGTTVEWERTEPG